MSSSTAVILGAGFSHVAGLPLAKSIFDSELLIPSQRAGRRYDAVLQEWMTWKSAHPSRGPEEFLTELYSATTPTQVPWAWAAELVAAILATPLPHDRGPYQLRYAGRITRPVKVPIHEVFWNVVLSNFALTAVVTCNYDLLAERGLRHRPMQRPNRPGVYYGGLSRPQILVGTALPFSVTKPMRHIELEGNIPLYKLHGSLNWGSSAGAITFYQDLRSAFRAGGNAQIIPPVLEKEAPSWLLNIWDEAKQALSSCSTWLVCGYSLPIYDKAINALFADAGAADAVTKIIVMDPYASELASRWQAVAPDAKVYTLPGLPDAFSLLLRLAQEIRGGIPSPI